MKRTYITPNIQSVDIKNGLILAGSTPTDGGLGVPGDYNQSRYMQTLYNYYEEWDEE